MTAAEVGKLLAVAQGAYPEKTAFWNNAVKANLAKAWFMVLQEYSYEQGSVALTVYLKSDRYNRFPGVGQIVEIIENLKDKSEAHDMTAAEAWGIVRPAIRDGLYHSRDSWEKFPDMVKTAVGDPDRLKEWAQLPSETIDSVVRADFCNRAYPAAVKRQQEYDRLPVNVRKVVEQKRAESIQMEENRAKSIEASSEDDAEEEETLEVSHSDHSEQLNELVRSILAGSDKDGSHYEKWKMQRQREEAMKDMEEQEAKKIG